MSEIFMMWYLIPLLINIAFLIIGGFALGPRPIVSAFVIAAVALIPIVNIAGAAFALFVILDDGTGRN